MTHEEEVVTSWQKAGATGRTPKLIARDLCLEPTAPGLSPSLTAVAGCSGHLPTYPGTGKAAKGLVPVLKTQPSRQKQKEHTH